MLTPAQAEQAARWIASVQAENGAIPWFAGGHLDPWDHTQAAMGLASGGFGAEAVRAYEWLASAQRPDGSWAIKYWPHEGDRIDDAGTDANYTAYIATGVEHAARLGLDVEHLWPAVDAALECVLSLRNDAGLIPWARNDKGNIADEVLLTSSSSIAMSLRRGVELAKRWGHERERWLDAALLIEHAINNKPELFAPKERFSMDWYYPILCGVTDGAVAADRLAERWDEFVVPGKGIRCVTVNAWVTGGETCEFVLALESLGRGDEARAAFADIQHLRDDDGTWWTGLEYELDERWPLEPSTWTAGTAILAWDALTRATPAATIFHR